MNKTYTLDELYKMLDDVRKERVELCTQIKKDLIAFAANSGDLPSEDAEESAHPKLLDHDFSKNCVRSMSASHNEQLKLIDKKEKQLLKLVEEREHVAYFKQYTVLRHECAMDKAKHTEDCRAHTPRIPIPWRDDFWGNLGDVISAGLVFFIFGPLRTLFAPFRYAWQWICKSVADLSKWIVKLCHKRKSAPPKRADAESAGTAEKSPTENSRNAIPLRDDSALRDNDLSICPSQPIRYRACHKPPIRVDLGQEKRDMEVENG